MSRTTLTLPKLEEFNVVDYGAVGDGTTDCTTAFNNAILDARAVKGTVIIPPAATAYRLNSTVNVTPDASNQIWINIKAKGKAAEIKYYGSNNTAVFNIIGLKGGIWEGLCVAIQDGRTECVAFNIDTLGAANSTSFNTFKNFYINLGGVYSAGTAALRNEDCIGIRTGNGGDGGDISNYNFENITVFGGGQIGAVGATSVCLGQYAFQNLGANCLSMCWYGGFVAACDRAYSNINRAGSVRGNGSAMFYGMGGSQNNVDFRFTYEQTYIVSGGRWEAGNKFLHVTNGGYASVNIQGIVISDYKSVPIITLDVPCSLIMNAVQIVKTAGGTFATPCISLASNGTVGCLAMIGCGFATSGTKPYVKTGTTTWNVTGVGNTKTNGVFSSTMFANELGIDN